MGQKSSIAARVTVLGYTAYQLLFENRGVDPVGKTVRIGSDQFEVVGVFASRPSPGNFSLDQDDFAIIPNTTYQRVYGVQVAQNFRGTIRTPVMIAVVPRGRDQSAAGDRRNRAHHAEPARAQAGRAKRFRHRDAGRRHESLGVRSARQRSLRSSSSHRSP